MESKYLQQREDGLWLTEDERENLKVSYRIREVVFAQDSPVQNIMILDSYDFGRMLVLDGVVQTTSIDGYIYNELIAHVPLNFHPNARNVLIIGGGDLGAAREVAKYPNIEQIDLVEIDELVVKVCKEYLPEVSGNLSDPRVNFLYQDGVKFVQNIQDQYDVIIVDSSDPVGPAQQLFELSFYKDLYRALREDGLMVCQSQSPIFHQDILTQTYKHIQSLFPVTKLYTAIVPTYPGGLWSFTLGSKKYATLTGSVRGKNTLYVNQEILENCFNLPEFLKRKIS